MFHVTYRCNYREYWYDDLPPYQSLGQAAQVALMVARQRRTVARVIDDYGRVLYQT